MLGRVTSLIKMQKPLRNRGLLFASGVSKPADSTDGYQGGCIFQDTTNAIVYINEGSVTSCSFKVVEAGTFANGIVFPDTITTRVLDYADTTAIDEPSTGHLIRYGASGSPIPWTPTETCNGIQMYITSTGPTEGGFALAGVRVKVTLTGTTKITVNAGNFWTKIDCTDYTGHYLGGHPSGLQGVIELAGTARNATSQYAVMAGVVGEVRPITTSGNVDLGGVICGVHAKVFALASEVNTGDVVGLFVQTLAAGAADIGILVQPHVSATWTTGLEFDSSYGAITNGIVFTGTVATRILDYANTTAIDEPGAGHLIRYGASDAEIPWTPTATCNGLQMYITSTGPSGGGFALAGVRVRVTLTGTTKITANAGNFWTKIDCTDYTGHYQGGHPTGLQGVIELAGSARNAESIYAVLAGVTGEVRPITTSGNVDLGGVICGLHAKVFATAAQVNTGSVVGLFVQTLSASAADIGILIQPHISATWTTGLKFDASYGTIVTGIDIDVTTMAITAAVSALPANTRGALFTFTCPAPAMDDGYGAHAVDLEVGTGTGNAAASASWVNIKSGGTAAAGGYYCANSDGIWEDSGATVTDAILVFGSRLTAAIGDTDYSRLVPFSLNCTQNMSALFMIGSPDAKVGIVIAGGGNSNAVGSAALFIDSNGTTYYVKLYSDVAA